MRMMGRSVLLVLALAAPAAAQPAAYQAVLDQMQAEGLFDRAAGGDDAAASYFVREFVWRINPLCDPAKPGALRKTAGGKNIDGYAEDAIALNGNPADLRNVVDLVGGAGAPGARVVWGGPVQRRASDVWECPKPLGAREAAYIGLRPVTSPVTPVTPPVTQPPTDLGPVLAKLDALAATVADLRTVLDEVRSSSATAAFEATNAAGRASELKTQIDNLPATFQWPDYRGGVLGFQTTLRPVRP